jgi:hypothetical protein
MQGVEIIIEPGPQVGDLECNTSQATQALLADLSCDTHSQHQVYGVTLRLRVTFDGIVLWVYTQ